MPSGAEFNIASWAFESSVLRTGWTRLAAGVSNEAEPSAGFVVHRECCFVHLNDSLHSSSGGVIGFEGEDGDTVWKETSGESELGLTPRFRRHFFSS